jgi:outer membrane protein
MKTLRLKFLVPLACLVLLALASPAAEPKIATIDLAKVFSDYYKTKLADAAIKEEITGLEKDRKAYIEDLQKAGDDYKKAIDEANNQAVSAEEREKRKKEAEGKLIKINDLKQTLEQFDRTAKGNMDEKMRQTRDKIVNEIKNVVSAKAKSAGYTMVLDSSSAEPGGRPPVIIYTNGENDITTNVLTQLNANAPTDLPRIDDRKLDKKEEKKK